MAESEAPAAPTQYLTFQLAGDEYALPVLRVREIIPHRPATRVPMTPDYVRGVINLRGSVVPVVDLGHKFGLHPVDVSARTCIVIADVADVDPNAERLVVGLLAESVNTVIELRAEDVEPPPRLGTPIAADHLLGMARLESRGDGFVPILEIDGALSSAELIATTGGAEPGPEAGARPDAPKAP